MKKSKEEVECTLSEEDLKKLKKEMIESLSIDRHSLLTKFPFIGNLLLRMDLVPVRDKRVRTACTDGNKVFFDISFYQKLSNQQRTFVLAHELFHCILLHLVRCQTRIPDIYNIASDMEVNYCLQQQSVGGDLTPPEGLCFPPKSMQGKSAEVIYEWLIRKMKQQKKSGQEMNIPNGSPSNSRGRSSNDWGNAGNQEDDGDVNQSPKSHGKDTGKLEGQFDNHKFESELSDQSQDSNVEKDPKSGKGSGKRSEKEATDQWGKVGYDPDYCPNTPKDFADRMREAVIAEAQRCQRTQGKLPAGLERILASMPKPEVNWKEELAAYVSSIPNGRHVWLPPNRRYVYNEMYFQSRRSEKIKVAALVDTSGSCWGDLSKFFSELNSLLKSFGDYELTIVQCDAAVHDVTKYDNDNPFPIDDPKAIEVNGCGGSDFRPGFKKMREDGIENDVDAIICLTDGYIDFPQYPPSKPCLIVLTKDGDKNCCSWGKKIVFKESSVDTEGF